MRSEGQMNTEAQPELFEVPIGEAIFRIRSSKELSHLDIQRETGIHRNTLVRIEKGERPPSLTVLVKIAKVLDVELWRLLKYAQRSAPKPAAPKPTRKKALNSKEPISGIKPFHARVAEQKYRARTILNNAIYSGYVDRLPCAVCGDKISQAHHDDYSKALDVVWLCRSHHGERHRAMRLGRVTEKNAPQMVQ
jgi:transcriptional regulator with XRE-family HTH domain